MFLKSYNNLKSVHRPNLFYNIDNWQAISFLTIQQKHIITQLVSLHNTNFCLCFSIFFFQVNKPKVIKLHQWTYNFRYIITMRPKKAKFNIFWYLFSDGRSPKEDLEWRIRVKIISAFSYQITVLSKFLLIVDRHQK